MSNTYVADNIIDNLIEYEDFTSVVLTDISSPASNPYGISRYEGDTYSVNATSPNRFYHHVGHTTSIAADIASPEALAYDIDMNTGNIVSAAWTTDRLVENVGFTTSENQSIASPSTSPSGVDYKGDLYSCDDGGSSLVTWHVGFTTSANGTFSTGDANRGVIRDLISDFTYITLNDRVTKYIGFTSSSDSFFSTDASWSRGLHIDAAMPPSAVTSAQSFILFD